MKNKNLRNTLILAAFACAAIIIPAILIKFEVLNASQKNHHH